MLGLENAVDAISDAEKLISQRISERAIDGNFALAFISLVGDDMVSWNGYTIATRPREI
jgi:hypothetical protein